MILNDWIKRTKKLVFINSILEKCTNLNPIRVAINMEQIGSAIIHPNWFMRTADIITPTLPRVSASMWRKTPGTQQIIQITHLCSYIYISRQSIV